MAVTASATALIVLTTLSGQARGDDPGSRVQRVARTAGLVAFWNFSLMEDGRWTSYRCHSAVKRGYLSLA